MRIFTFLLYMSYTYLGIAQNNYSKEVSLVSDNDLYTSMTRDGYYTNGLFLNYRTVKNDVSETSPKRIYKLHIGHMMFTSSRSTFISPNSHDRPFAGYFYGGVGVGWFYKSNNLFTTNIQLGVIGPDAKGKELQDFMHSFYNYPEPFGWKYQIQNAFALNFNANYLYYISKISTNTLDVSNYSSLKAGTVFTSFSTGIYARIGLKKLQAFSNSVAFKSNLNINASSTKESFVFINPMLNYTLYDATIQGSFLNKSNPVTFDVMPFHFSLELGYRFYRKRFLYGYTYTFHTKKLKSLRAANNNSYGSIYIGYYFN